METVTLQLNSYLIKQIKVWAEIRGLTFNDAVHSLLSRAMWDHMRGC